MRRRAALIGASIAVLCMSLCGWAIVELWAARGGELIITGARDIQIVSQGVTRTHVSYRLASGRTLPDLRRFLLQQGWRRVMGSNADRTTLTYVRTGWPQPLREILIVSLDMGQGTRIDMQLRRCLKGAWGGCF